MRSSFIVLLALITSSAWFSGCSGDAGSGDATPPATTSVTLYHASGRVQAVGTYAVGTTIRSGAWTEYHDVSDSTKRWEGTYADGAIDHTRAWREWNADGSTRDDQRDR